MKTRCIFFDFDGVLCDLAEQHKNSLNQALNQVCKLTISDDDHYNKYNGLPTREKLKTLYQEGKLQWEDIDKVASLKQKYTLEELFGIKEDPSRIELLDWLTENHIVCACVSNAKRETVITGLKNVGVWNNISFVISNDDITHPKPHPDPYLVAWNKSRFLKEECLVVEDNKYGVQSAESAGLRVIQIPTFQTLTLSYLKDHL